MRVHVFTFYAFINDTKERDVFTLDGINPPDGDVTVAPAAALLGYVRRLGAVPHGVQTLSPLVPAVDGLLDLYLCSKWTVQVHRLFPCLFLCTNKGRFAYNGKQHRLLKLNRINEIKTNNQEKENKTIRIKFFYRQINYLMLAKYIIDRLKCIV